MRRRRQRRNTERGRSRCAQRPGGEERRSIQEIDAAGRLARSGAAANTVAVKVTLCPLTDGLADDVTVVAVESRVID